MAVADGIISNARLRQAIGEVGNSNDATLTAYRDAAIALVEKYVGRNIIDRAGHRSELDDFETMDMPDAITFRMPDLKDGTFVLHYSNYDDDPKGATDQTMSISTDSSTVCRTRDGVMILSGSTAWGSVLRTEYPTPYIVGDVGMVVEDIPTPWIEAIAVMVSTLR